MQTESIGGQQAAVWRGHNRVHFVSQDASGYVMILNTLEKRGWVAFLVRRHTACLWQAPRERPPWKAQRHSFLLTSLQVGTRCLFCALGPEAPVAFRGDPRLRPWLWQGLCGFSESTLQCMQATSSSHTVFFASRVTG